MNNIKDYEGFLNESVHWEPWANSYYVSKDSGEVYWLDGERSLADRDLSYEDLRTAEFDGEDMSGVNLEYAKISSASFKRCNLQGALFKESDLRWTDFDNANLENSKGLETCINLSKASFKGANLEGLSKDFFYKILTEFRDVEAAKKFFEGCTGVPVNLEKMYRGKSMFGV